MSDTPYFDAYERGERSASYIVAKYDILHRNISYASPRYNDYINIAEQLVSVQPMSGPTGRTFQFPIRNFCLEIDA